MTKSKSQLNGRESFRLATFSRDDYKCVMCDFAAQDAHHIIERRLWPDGGYLLDNGASVCGDCHLEAESTVISCEELRAAAGISVVVLPPGWDPNLRYDKWGNVIVDELTRVRGPLYTDESVQKVLRKNPRFWGINWVE